MLAPLIASVRQMDQMIYIGGAYTRLIPSNKLPEKRIANCPVGFFQYNPHTYRYDRVDGGGPHRFAAIIVTEEYAKTAQNWAKPASVAHAPHDTDERQANPIPPGERPTCSICGDRTILGNCPTCDRPQ